MIWKGKTQTVFPPGTLAKASSSSFQGVLAQGNPGLGQDQFKNLIFKKKHGKSHPATE